MKRLLRILVACLIVHLWSGVATAQQQCDAADACCKRAKAAWEQVRNQGELENAGARYEPNQPNRGSVVLATPGRGGLDVVYFRGKAPDALTGFSSGDG